MDVPDQPIIEYRDVSLRLGGRPILARMSFAIQRGEVFVIIGYSGTGKSVTLQTMVGLMPPDMGSIRISGDQIVGMDEKELQAVRRKFGYLFQAGALINWLTVAENVELPLREHTSLSRKRRQEIVRDKLTLVAMENEGHKYPADISGGMKKRAALARAIALDPEIVLFDEPTSGLDPVIAHQIDELICSLNKDLGITCVVVTHDMDSVYSIADRVGFIFEGGMRFTGTPEELRSSDDKEVQHFIGGGRDGEFFGTALRHKQKAKA